MEWKNYKKCEEQEKTLRKIQRVKAMLEQNKKMDETQQRTENSTVSRGNWKIYRWYE